MEGLFPHTLPSHPLQTPARQTGSSLRERSLFVQVRLVAERERVLFGCRFRHTTSNYQQLPATTSEQLPAITSTYKQALAIIST